MVKTNQLGPPTLIVVDHYWMRQTYGFQTHVGDHTEDKDTFAAIRFFEVSSAPVFKRMQEIPPPVPNVFKHTKIF